MGGGLAVDLTLDIRLRFGGRAGGCPDISFTGEPSTSMLKHTAFRSPCTADVTTHTACIQLSRSHYINHITLHPPAWQHPRTEG